MFITLSGSGWMSKSDIKQNLVPAGFQKSGSGTSLKGNHADSYTTYDKVH